MANLKIIYMGTPDFAVPTLEKIHEKYGVGLVVTLPDKAQGRGQMLTPTPIKLKANALGIKVLQPESLQDDIFIDEIKAFQPDIICVIAFRILPKKLYSLAKIASFNIHGSLLPKFRGAAPINHAIISGEKVTGLTSFILNDKVDTGNILLKQEYTIRDLMTAGELFDELKLVAPDLALETIEVLKSGNFTPLMQDESQSSPAPKIFRDKCKIDWNMDIKHLCNFIHGVSPIPCAWTLINGQVLKIYNVKPISTSLKPTATIEFTKDKIICHCAGGAVELITIQPANKKAMPALDLLRGWRGDRELLLG